MILLIRIELFKIFHKWRTYIGFIAIGILVPLIQIVAWYEGSDFLNMALSSLKEQFLFTGNLLNGYFLGRLLLNSLFVHIPFLIVLVGGDLLAGEAAAGTTRMVFSRPVSRFQIVSAKFIAGLIYTFLLLLWLALLSLGVSVLAFGTGELIVIRNQILVIAANDVLWRFLLAYGFAFLSMATVLSLSFLFSSLVQNAIGPIVGTLAVIIIFSIVSALPMHALEIVKPFLFTSHLDKWMEFMNDPINLSTVYVSGFVLITHIIGFYLITLFLFKRKDILS